MIALLLVAIASAASAPARPVETWEDVDRRVARLVNDAHDRRCDPRDRVCQLGRRSLANSALQAIVTQAGCDGADAPKRSGCGGDFDGHAAALVTFWGQLSSEDERNGALLGVQQVFPSTGPRASGAAVRAFIVRANADLDRSDCREEATVCTAGRLALLVQADQAARLAALRCEGLEPAADRACNEMEGALMMESDRRSTAAMEALINRVGWPDRMRFGAVAENDAWLLVQHADIDVPLQKRVLALITPLAKAGRSSPANYAYLTDRVAIADHKPQVFGTQGRCTGEGVTRRWESWPVIDPPGLETRRAGWSLPSEVSYRRSMDAICRGQP